MQSPSIRLGDYWKDLKQDGSYQTHPLQGGVVSIPHVVPGSGPLNPPHQLSEHMMKVMVVRNVSGGPILGGRTVVLNVAGADTMDGIHEVTGYANTINAQHCALSDPYIQSAGVPDKCLFLVVLFGPTYVTLPDVALDSGGDWVKGDWFCTAASGGTLTDVVGGRITHLLATDPNTALGWVLEAKVAAANLGGRILVMAVNRSFG